MAKATRAIATLAAGVLALAALLGYGITPTYAEAGGWAAPTLLYTSKYPVSAPAVVADQRGGVHVFWHTGLPPGTGDDAQKNLIYYTQRLDGGWSKPADVVASAAANAPSGAVDRFGNVYLFWQELTGELFVSSAPVSRAAAASSWTPHADVGLGNQDGSLVSDSAGRLYLAYPGAGPRGVFFQTLDDPEMSWSYPVTISVTAGINAAANFVNLAVGPDGTIHVVWTEFQLPDAWPPLGVEYTHSTDGGRTWSNPVEIAGPGFTQANVVAGPHGLVHVAWNGMSGLQGRYDRWSLDNGKTWSSAVPLGTLGVSGSEGPPQLAIDSAGTVHLLTTDGNRVWHLSWQDGRWSAPEYVPTGNESGVPPPDQAVPTKVRHIEQAVMALGEGNRLHVVFWDERPTGVYVWYTTKQVAAPPVAPRPFATATATPEPAPSPSATPAVLASPTAARVISGGFVIATPTAVAPSDPPDARLTILFGVIPTTLLVLTIVLIRLRSRDG